MEINEKAPGNISQGAITSGTDNETGFDARRDAGKAPVADEDIDKLEGHDLIEPQEPGIDVLSEDQNQSPLPSDDDAALDEEDMGDVDINNLVSGEHPES